MEDLPIPALGARRLDLICYGGRTGLRAPRASDSTRLEPRLLLPKALT